MDTPAEPFPHFIGDRRYHYVNEANKMQIGGGHYKPTDGVGEEHWDRVARLGLDYFQGQITKYVERCWLKNGIQDLEKAQHFIQKYIEVSKGRIAYGQEQAETMLTIGKELAQSVLESHRTEDLIKELSRRGPEADVLRNWTSGELMNEIRRRTDAQELANMEHHAVGGTSATDMANRVFVEPLEIVPPMPEIVSEFEPLPIDDENGVDDVVFRDYSTNPAAGDRGPICKECGAYPAGSAHARTCSQRGERWPYDPRTDDTAG